MLPLPEFIFEERLTRERLTAPSHDQAVGGPPLWFGVLFMLIGGGILVSYVIKGEKHMELWVGGVGVTFFLTGAMVMLAALGARKPAPLAARPEMQDYPWEESGAVFTHTRTVLSRLGGAFVITAFAATMGGAFFFEHGSWTPPSGWSWVPGVIILGMAALSLYVWGDLVRKLIAALRFGPSRVDFVQFPYRVGEAITLVWHCPKRLDRVQGAQFTLRCVEQWMETTRTSNGETSTKMIHEALWTGSHRFTAETLLEQDQTIRLSYSPPDHLPRSCLAGPCVIFWRLEIRLQLAGPNFEATYLVPVY